MQLRKDEVLSPLFALYSVASVLYVGDKFGGVLYSGSFVAGSIFYLTLRNSSDWELPLLKTILIGGCTAGLCEALWQVHLLPVRLFYNPNPLSGFLTPLVVVALYLYAKGTKKLYLALAMLLSGLAILYRKQGDLERSEQFAAKARRLYGLTDDSSAKDRAGP